MTVENAFAYHSVSSIYTALLLSLCKFNRFADSLVNIALYNSA